MDVLYKGFDGLDVSFSRQINHDLCEALEAAKLRAQETRCSWPLVWNGVQMLVLESGARGGYAYAASTGLYGATWFFKRPSSGDPWGIRVSCNSFGLATRGLGGARADLYETLGQLGIDDALGTESIGRIDYAIDVLVPTLVLDPHSFVMHSNARRSDHHEPAELTVSGTSGRVTSVTVGKMPGRQVIVYDKRAEIIEKQKVGWWLIWDAARERSGFAPLNRAAPSESRVWRVELRAGKRHLKDHWAIRTWADLDLRLGDMIEAMLKAVRHTQPSADSNRSRWPTSELWDRIGMEAGSDLFEMRCWADPDLVRLVQKEAHDQLLARQMIGILVSRAALDSKDVSELSSFAIRVGQEMADSIVSTPSRFNRKLEHAKTRYSVVNGDAPNS